ncbi:Shr3 amino acid permease chaperone [Phakopsora pachyrhizi]|uniref:Shr3 amino acid permease chaperone n=1 Tax=Phakopsora pachyrhizi TaxID=170000 RepID=A0AAV0AFA4_PHAPC|nr:Shr3 amino acid permease chaperone [Phakopsora pachyrhizi]CAH7665851.1 Shr3 amino acid permease chaperone [Phakopsora pachyrhizi]
MGSDQTFNSSINSFSTSILLSSVGFLLGTLFMALITDHGLLYTGQRTTSEAYLRAEHFYLTLWTSPLAVKALFHIVLLTPIFTLSIRLSRFTQSALYFDGISLLLSLIVLGLYTGSTIPNLRKLASSPSDQSFIKMIFESNGNLKDLLNTQFDPSSPLSFFNRFLVLMSYPTTIILKPELNSNTNSEAGLKLGEREGEGLEESARRELLSVTAAGHSIAIFLLIGVLILQAGKVYAEHEEFKLLKKFEKDQEKVKKDQ